MPYSGGPGPGVQPGIFIPDGALDAWNQARTQAGSQIVPIALLGDSVTRGQQATAGTDRHFAARFVAALQAKLGSAGEGFHSVSDTLDNAFSFTGYSPAVRPCWTFGGTWNRYTYDWGVGSQCHTSTAAGATATGVFTGSTVEVVGLQGSYGGPFAVTIDGVPYDKNGVAGGGAGNPTANGVLADNMRLFSAAGLGPGLHTIVLTVVSGGLALHGITCLNGQPRGILPYVIGASGKSMYGFGFINLIDSYKASVEGWARQPRLVINAYGINDLQQGIAYETFVNSYRRIADSAKVCGASLLFLIPYMSPLGPGLWTNAPYAQHYVERIYELARRYNAAVLDMNPLWEGLGIAGATAMLYSASDGHPGDAGHADIANRLMAIVG